jgi:hypothetical protein
MSFSDGSTFMAWKGVEGDPRIWWNEFLGDSWSTPRSNDAIGSTGGVALAAPSGGPLVMAWKGRDTDQRIFWSRLDSPDGAWSGQQPVAGANTSVGPALAAVYGEVFMAWKGVEGDERIWWNLYDGTNWSAPQVVPGANTSFGPALAHNRIGDFGEPIMAWKGVQGDQRIWWNAYTGGSTGSNQWTGPTPLDDIGTSAAVAITGPLNGGADMAWKGINDDQRIFWRLMTPDGAWTGQAPVGGANSSVGPALAIYGPDSTVMAWKGVAGDQAIWWNRLDSQRSWTSPQPVPGASTSFRPALATVGG